MEFLKYINNRPSKTYYQDNSHRVSNVQCPQTFEKETTQDEPRHIFSFCDISSVYLSTSHFSQFRCSLSFHLNSNDSVVISEICYLKIINYLICQFTLKNVSLQLKINRKISNVICCRDFLCAVRAFHLIDRNSKYFAT